MRLKLRMRKAAHSLKHLTEKELAYMKAEKQLVLVRTQKALRPAPLDIIHTAKVLRVLLMEEDLMQKADTKSLAAMQLVVMPEAMLLMPKVFRLVRLLTIRMLKEEKHMHMQMLLAHTWKAIQRQHLAIIPMLKTIKLA